MSLIRPTEESIADFASGGCIPAVLNALLAGLCGLIGLLGLLLQWFASINLNPANLTHLAGIIVCWIGILFSFFSAWKLLRNNTLRNLLWALPPVLLIVFVFWLWSLPGAKGLMH